MIVPIWIFLDMFIFWCYESVMNTNRIQSNYWHESPLVVVFVIMLITLLHLEEPEVFFTYNLYLLFYLCFNDSNWKFDFIESFIFLQRKYPNWSIKSVRIFTGWHFISLFLFHHYCNRFVCVVFFARKDGFFRWFFLSISPSISFSLNMIMIYFNYLTSSRIYTIIQLLYFILFYSFIYIDFYIYLFVYLLVYK